MRVLAVALLSGVVLLGACGGGETKNAATDTPTPAATPAPTGAVAAVPATGTIHVVNMVGDATGFRFEPANITVKPGDGIKFVNVSGGPHNVAFDPATIPADVKPSLMANMPNQMAELSGPLLTQPNEAYTVSFGGVKPGAYPHHCTPHLAMNMKGVITVQ